MPRLLDLFCCAGGAGTGYHRAGFEVVGVDIDPQKNYPFEFHQADAMTFPLEGFDAIHASPPCQMYSRALKHMAAPQPMLIDAIKERLVDNGAPWIIENVEGSPIPFQSDLFGAHGVMLCGSAFGMRVYRHRLFEASFPLVGPPCSHTRLAMNPHNVKGRELMYAEFGRSDPEVIWRKDMGVEWMGRYEAREAIPPAFTEYLGHQLMQVVEGRGSDAREELADGLKEQAAGVDRLAVSELRGLGQRGAQTVELGVADGGGGVHEEDATPEICRHQTAGENLTNEAA